MRWLSLSKPLTAGKDRHICQQLIQSDYRPHEVDAGTSTVIGTKVMNRSPDVGTGRYARANRLKRVTIRTLNKWENGANPNCDVSPIRLSETVALVANLQFDCKSLHMVSQPTNQHLANRLSADFSYAYFEVIA